MKLPATLHSGPNSRVNVRVDPEDPGAVAVLLGVGATWLPDPPAGLRVLVAAHTPGSVEISGRAVPVPCLRFDSAALRDGGAA